MVSLMGYTVIVIVFMVLVLPHWKPETIVLITCNTRPQEMTPLGSAVMETKQQPCRIPAVITGHQAAGFIRSPLTPRPRCGLSMVVQQTETGSHRQLFDL